MKNAIQNLFLVGIISLLISGCGSSKENAAATSNPQSKVVDEVTIQLIGTIDAQAAYTTDLLSGGRTNFNQEECNQWWQYQLKLNDDVEQFNLVVNDLELIGFFCEKWHDSFVAATSDASRIIISNPSGWKSLAKKAAPTSADYENTRSKTCVGGTDIELIQDICFTLNARGSK